DDDARSDSSVLPLAIRQRSLSRRVGNSQTDPTWHADDGAAAPNSRTQPMITGVIWLIVLLVVLGVAGTAAWAGWRAAPYLPTRQKDVERMTALGRINPGELVYDLGAGDGRFLIAAAKRGATAVGFEISLLPY